MSFRDRLAERFEHRLREGDSGIGFWGWFALVVVVLTAITILVGVFLSFDHFDNIGTAIVGLLIGTTLLAATSPGWAMTTAVRRHRRRLGARQAAFSSRRTVADELYAFGLIDEATHHQHCLSLDAFLGGTGRGDAARVAATWARVVGGLVLTIGVVAGAISGTLIAWDEPELLAVALTGAPVSLALAAVGIGLLAIAMGLSVQAAEDNRGQTREIEAGYRSMLGASHRASTGGAMLKGQDDKAFP